MKHGALLLGDLVSLERLRPNAENLIVRVEAVKFAELRPGDVDPGLWQVDLLHLGGLVELGLAEVGPSVSGGPLFIETLQVILHLSEELRCELDAVPDLFVGEFKHAGYVV